MTPGHCQFQRRRGGSCYHSRFAHTPGKIKNNDSGDSANDHYHLYQEDVALMKSIGATAYRFSIAWPRIFPEGTGQPNPKSIGFDSRLVDELLAAGIEPFATLYHWDLPLALQDRCGGWESIGDGESVRRLPRVRGRAARRAGRSDSRTGLQARGTCAQARNRPRRARRQTGSLSCNMPPRLMNG